MSNPSRLFMKQLIMLCLIIASPLLYADDTYSPYPNATPARTLSFAEKNYAALQQAIPLYEEASNHPWPLVPENAKLRPGVKNLAVLALRARLLATGELIPENNHGLTKYDDELTEAVMRFQARHGLTVDGRVGKQTFYELNISPSERLHQIEVNMERFAKLADQLNDHFIMVNVPDFRLNLIDHGHTVLTMKAIVGKPERPTPELTSTITSVVFNPYWNVPKLIAQNDIVPKVIDDPNYLNSMHIKIINRDDEYAPEISPDEIDWFAAKEDGFPYHFRQDPGNKNALGLVKFEFRNSHDVYLHDTPAKDLFEKDKRDFSSGCIRLEKPFELVTYLMQDNPAWTNDRVDEILEIGKTKYINIPTPTPVIITYLTAWADDYGNIQFRDDIYNRDNPLDESDSIENRDVYNQ